jgi:2-hydroxycyclohexanecarboxyl-CoA dehydrogenase
MDPTIEGMSSMDLVGRAGTPDDVAAACAFLCSDEASYITDQLVGVKGGMYI